MKYLKISVIIPVYNRKESLVETLEYIFKSNYPDFEVIVYDDASTDNISEAIKKFPCIYIRSEKNSGPAVGRNVAAKKANGDILLFTDSDILMPADTLFKINEQISKFNYDGIVGVLSADIRFKNYSSNYKNLYMHYMYKKMPSLITCFFTSLAAIKKSVFNEVGGFDENFGKIPCEDNELGLRISTNHKLFLLHDLEVEHVRHYTFIGLLKSNFSIASSLIRTMLRHKSRNQKYRKDLPTSGSYALSVGLSGMCLILLPASVFKIYFLFAAVLIFLIILAINKSLLIFFLKKKGLLFFVKSCFYIFISLLSYGFGSFIGIVGFLSGKKY